VMTTADATRVAIAATAQTLVLTSFRR